jgi:hypothetical protein
MLGLAVSIKPGTTQAQGLTGRLHSHVGTELGHRLHQLFFASGFEFSEIPSSSETFFWTSMMISAFLSF